MMEMRTLTVTSIGPTLKENVRVTLSPADIRIVLVLSEIPVMHQDAEYRNVNVVFADGFTHEMVLSEYDINLLESTVGGFGYPD